MNQFFVAFGAPKEVDVFCQNANVVLELNSIDVFKPAPFAALTLPFAASEKEVRKWVGHLYDCTKRKALQEVHASIGRLTNAGRKSAFYLPLDGQGMSIFMRNLKEELVPTGFCNEDSICSKLHLPIVEVRGRHDDEPYHDVMDLIGKFAPAAGPVVLDTLYLVSFDTGERYTIPLAA